MPAVNCFKAEHPTLFLYHFLTTMCVKGVKYFSESASRGKEFFLSLLGYSFN